MHAATGDRLQGREHLIGGIRPGKLLGAPPYLIARQLQRSQTAWRKSVCMTPPPESPMTSIGPATGKAATGVPQAIASAMTSPKVSVTLVKTMTSAER